MCMITIYRDSVKEENKIAEKVTSYRLDLASGKITVYPMLQDPQELTINKAVSWDESNDSMIIE